jgi:hypothetical protein
LSGARGCSPPKKARNPSPGTFGRLVSALLAIFHIHELRALNTIGNIIGLAVTAGHRLLTRTREQEPMGRSRRTRTREPPGGAHSTPAQDSWPGSSRRETRELEDGWVARTRAHPPRRLATARGESEVTEAHCPASPTPPPRRGLIFWGVPPAVGIVGPEDPRPKSLQSWREGWGLLWAVSSITCDHCFEAPGSQAHQAIRGPSL